jgi:hypothetical protein
MYPKLVLKLVWCQWLISIMECSEIERRTIPVEEDVAGTFLHQRSSCIIFVVLRLLTGTYFLRNFRLRKVTLPEPSTFTAY